MAWQSGASAFCSDAAAYWCSSFSLAEPSSAVARSESSAGVAPRGVVPARTSELTRQPSLLISSSGVAPTRPSQANV